MTIGLIYRGKEKDVIVMRGTWVLGHGCQVYTIDRHYP